jgi:hypothetical protein
LKYGYIGGFVEVGRTLMRTLSLWTVVFVPDKDV